jgi:Domain of unknown function (DUF4386)
MGSARAIAPADTGRIVNGGNMKSEQNLGRVVGLLMLLTMATSIAGYFVLLPPVFEAPGFLAAAAGKEERVRAAALVLLLPPLLSLAIALACWPQFRRASERTALALAAMAVVALAVAAVEQGLLLAMLSLSQAAAEATSTATAPFAAAYAAAGGARYAVHYLALFFSGATSLTLYVLLYRSGVLPRALPAIGVAAVVLQLANIALHLLGHPFQFALVAPAALCQLATGVWLVARGFRSGVGLPAAHAH